MENDKVLLLACSMDRFLVRHSEALGADGLHEEIAKKICTQAAMAAAVVFDTWALTHKHEDKLRPIETTGDTSPGSLLT